MKNLINSSNKLVRWPTKLIQKQIVINWLSEKFKSNRIYSEREVNNIINNYHSFNNIALLRRELISMKLLGREKDGSKYWKNG